ncbi:MAG: hypothetical protein ACRD2B_08415 [Terriglobia bacterium]
MICPICQKRKAKRFCPAKGESICTVCCGTEREVTIDCPSDCPHLLASRGYYEERRIVDWEKVPFREKRIERSILEAHEQLFMKLACAICDYARENSALVDSDVHVVLLALAETWQTRANGILYENPPNHRMQGKLYEQLEEVIESYQKSEKSVLVAVISARDSEIRDLVILFAQIASTHSNGRPKGRELLDFLRSQFDPGTFSRSTPALIVAP